MRTNLGQAEDRKRTYEGPHRQKVQLYTKHFSFCMCSALNWTINGIEIQLFCYIINSQIMENENASVT